MFLAPMADINEATAKRNFAIQINKTAGTMNFKPDDFDLYRIGSFTDHNGQIETESPYEFICNGAALVGE